MIYTPAIKLTLHEQYRNFIEGKNRVNVLNVEISLSGICKAGCPWCFYRGHMSGKLMDAARCDRAIKEIIGLGGKAITWSGGGEPTAHPDLPRLIEDNPGISHGLFTNALYPCAIKPELLKWVRITWSPKLTIENVFQYRGVKKLGLVVNYSGDETIIELALMLAIETGMQYVHVRPALDTKGRTVDIRPPSIKHQLLEYQGYKFEAAGEKQPYKKCYGYHFVPFIKENGDVFSCYYMAEDAYKLGNIYENSMGIILFLAARSLPVVETCQVCCKNNEINMLLNYALDIQDKDFV